jgi:hypothetical protein
VHNLEHGQVVVAYKGLSAADLKTLLKQRSYVEYHVVVLPREANPKAGIYYLAWDHRLYCQHPSAAAFQHMVDTYIDQGPELITGDSPR